MNTPFCVVYVTTPKGAGAKKLSQSLLKGRLAACVTIIPAVASSYWWKGKIESAGEAFLVIKTRRSLLKKLIPFIKKNHPYTVPEIIALPIIAGHKPYLKWIKAETR